MDAISLRARNGNPGIVPQRLQGQLPELAGIGHHREHGHAGHAHAPGGGTPTGLPTDRIPERQPSANEARAAAGALREIKQYFTKLGVSAREGNGPGPDVRFADFANAAYVRNLRTGQERMEIGYAPGRDGESFAFAKDVLAHEYAHRVITHNVTLGGAGEPGVVGESLADTFAAAIDRDDWTIGEDVGSKPMRSMDRPDGAAYAKRLADGSRLAMPAHIDDYLDLPVHPKFDMGGVHLNVGIPNKAASIIGKRLGRDEMAGLYMDAVRKHLPDRAGIGELALATLRAAQERYGSRSEGFTAVADAWKAVGVARDRQPSDAAQARMYRVA